MRTVSFTSPYDAQQAQIQREQDYADQLIQQSQQPLQGGMAGRMYVPPHATQGLAQLAQALSGRMASKAAGEKMTGLANDRSKAYADALNRYTQTGDPGALMSNPDTAAYGMTAQQAKQKALADALQAEETERLRAERERAGRDSQQAFDAEQGRLDRQARIDAARERAAAGGAASYFTPVYGADGAYAFNNRTGAVEPITGATGAPIVRATDSPALQGDLAGAKASGALRGEASTQAALDYPRVDAEGAYAESLIDSLMSHKGLEGSVGVPGVGKFFPGTDEQGFMSRLKQIEGQQFLQAFQSLKGGGAITQIEGEKATASMARLQTAQSEKEFKEALTELKGVISTLRERARKRATTGESMSGAGGADPGGAPAAGGWSIQPVGN